MDTSHRLVDGMLADTVDTRQLVKRLFDIVHEHLVIQGAIVLPVEVLQGFQLFYIRTADIRSEIEVKGGNSLTTMHLVLGTFQRDTSKHCRRLDTFGRTTGAMPCDKALCQDIVKRVLHTGQ